MKRLSVIIPVHNAEADLPRCLDSILGQLSPEDEVLLIEDSSTDGSRQLCDAYAAENPLIRTYHVNFKGPSPTRNHGVEQSQGRFILFIDADDWIESNTVASMLEKMTHHQMVVGGYYLETDSGSWEKRLRGMDQLDKSQLLELYRTELLNVLWNKIFVASIIKEQHIAFDHTLKKGEDLLFILQYLAHITTPIAVLDGCFYHYISKTTGINRSHRESIEDKITRLHMTVPAFEAMVTDRSRLSRHMLNLYFRLIRDYLATHSCSVPAKLVFIKKQGRRAVVKELLAMDPKPSVMKALHWAHMDLSMFVVNKLLLK